MARKKKKVKTFILNATPLIYLCKVGLSHIFKEFAEEKFITSKVEGELVEKGKEMGAPDAFIVEQLIKKGDIQIKTPQNKEFMNILTKIPDLYEAEIQVLALTKELDGIAILDDSVARQVAVIFNIELHGTIYLLLRLYYRGKFSKEQIIKIVDKMIAMGWRLTAEDYSKIMEKLK